MSDKMEAGHCNGHCLCGAVRYRVTHPFDGDIAHCHCAACRRSAGSVALTWFTVPRSGFEVTEGALTFYKSSDHGERGFCGKCGSQITFATTKHPNDIDVTLATLDHPEDHPATMHIWTSSRLPWVKLDENLPGREN